MSARNGGRVELLADALAERRIIRLREAAQLLRVSEMTVRRDLAAHVDRFAYLGGHIMLAAEIDVERPYELAIAAGSHSASKRQACAHAVQHVRNEETIFIDCGTTLVHLVDLIPAQTQITAVCYALNVAEKLAKRGNATIVMLGGLYHPASASFSGQAEIPTLDGLGINVAFLSAAGVGPARGATCEHFHEAEVKRKVMGVARESYLVVDTSKLGKLRRAFFAPLDAFKAIITEDGETSPEENAKMVDCN